MSQELYEKTISRVVEILGEHCTGFVIVAEFPDNTLLRRSEGGAALENGLISFAALDINEELRRSMFPPVEAVIVEGDDE